ncbi:unnamed protein product [Paramecium pentaurelia]|uniref:Alpha-glucosidase n=1 Tax=Paramecium pentaurelia TaxID=43138 RepID=A0A8S1WEP1_9CILI|nr:unnamed protein product [Paramecium pentaurelia]
MFLIICLYFQVTFTQYIATQIRNDGQIQQYKLHTTNEMIVKNGQSIKLNQILILEIRFENDSQLDIQIFDEDRKHFRIPQQPPFNYKDIENPLLLENYNYSVIITNDLVTIQIYRDDRVIFTISELVYSENYIEFTHYPQNKQMWGLGERNQVGFRFKQGIYTLYARDEPNIIEDGKRPGKNVYSSHPVLLSMEDNGKFNIMFYKSSSPMDIIYQEERMKFITIGGIIHLKLFLGDYSPRTVIKQYHNYLGGWILPPFWSFGFHQSRWGYNNSSKLVQVVEQYQKNKIPIDTIWSDIDYMHDRQIFSVDSNRFTKQDYENIRNLGVRYIPIVDVAVGVKYGNQDEGYKKGIEYDIFVYSPETGYRFQGRVWPGESYFPDFFHPNISKFWNEMHKHLYNQVEFDGLWVDMNEPANFCDGECGLNSNLHNHQQRIDKMNENINFAYIPGAISLSNKTLPPHLIHYGNYLHKDVHNLYGIMDSYYTYQALKELGKIQPFQITRSTFPGTGKYAQHWTGDNGASWDFLYLSLGQIFSFQIYGIPMVGADVCGFMGDTNIKLCSRWIQLGIFYPFFRNHNNDLSKSQEFYNIDHTVIQTAQKNIHLRYSLLKWYYSIFIREQNHGTIINPLFFVFPQDNMSYRDFVMDTQFIIGNELMGAPILDESITRKAYFPESEWYDLITGLNYKGQQDHILHCSYSDITPIFIRSGYLILQNTKESIQNVKSLDNHYRLIAAISNLVSIGVLADLKDFENEEEAINAQLINFKLEILKDVVILNLSQCQSELIIEEIIIYGQECIFQNCISGFYKQNSIFIGPFNLGKDNLKLVLQ